MGYFDWAIMALYALGLLLVGRYYSLRVKTVDDYLLGGRAMKPWAVGLSLFASLLSTLSYLSTPGEMIKHGPIIVGNIIVFPLIAFVVGRYVIPRFMRLRVTSAYELLEERLGLQARILGALLFLGMRMMWMAVILHATSSQILIPLMGWDIAATPYVCIALGVLTIIYTSSGGLKAVVVTDVIQTVVLLVGALLAVVVISVNMGGVSNWLPTEWVATWDPLKIWFDPGSRATVAASCLAGFSWYVCTAASDQISIQRYLATPDVRSARKMYSVSLAANVLVTVLLCCLGLALLAWFQTHPQMLPAGKSISDSADQLLPRFIVVGLPAGISGLVVAALMSAAMSSLSSGINSACTVITVDLAGRFHRSEQSEPDHLRSAKFVSWIVGAAVVGLSLWANVIPGNLLEVSFKTANLLVGPLFVLFCMALYVSWATSLGALVGTFAAIAFAIGVSFFEFLELSFLWNIPGSALVGVTVGALLSAVTCWMGKSKPITEDDSETNELD